MAERSVIYAKFHIFTCKNIRPRFKKRSGKREKKITQKREENEKIEKNCLFNNRPLFWLTSYAILERNLIVTFLFESFTLLLHFIVL